MKNFFLKHGQITILLIILFSVLGLAYYTHYIRPNQVIQEVEVLSFNKKLRLYEDWEEKHPFIVTKDGRITGDTTANPYEDLDKPMYELITRQGDYYKSDYGTEAEILAKKCVRLAEFEASKVKRIADKEAEELAEEKRLQAEEDALDRLNDKSCK